MFCPKCGNELPEGALFCGSCGTKIEGREDAVSAAAGSSETPANEKSAPSSPNTGAAPVVNGVPLTPKKSKKTRYAIIGAAAAVVVVGVIGVYTAFFAPYNLDEGTFPDSTVRIALSNNVDVDGNGSISREEAAELTSLNLSGTGVSSLDGLEKFPNLKSLNLASAGSLSDVDFSKVKEVVDLTLTDSSIEAADISMLGNLESLAAKGTDLKELDVSKNTKLTELKLDNDVVVTGLDSTGLREQYVMVREKLDGITGAIDGQGGYSMYDDNEIVFTYNDDNILTSYMQYYSTSSGSDSGSSGREYTIENGRIVSSESTGASTTTTATVTYGEKAPDQIDEVESWYQSSSSSALTRYSMEYNDAGKLIEKKTKYDSGSVNKTTYKYNDAGKLTSFTSTYDSSSETTGKYAYDKQGRVKKITLPYMVFEFKYNDAGQVKSKKYWYLDGDGNKSGDGYDITFTYDDAGRVASAKRATESGSYSWEFTAKVTYDENGLVSHIDRATHSVSGGKTYDDEGTEDFEYERVFTAKDAADVQMPLVLGDPTTSMQSMYPLRIAVLDEENQLPIVCQVADANNQSNVIL